MLPDTVVVAAVAAILSEQCFDLQAYYYESDTARSLSWAVQIVSIHPEHLVVDTGERHTIFVPTLPKPLYIVMDYAGAVGTRTRHTPTPWPVPAGFIEVANVRFYELDTSYDS